MILDAIQKVKLYQLLFQIDQDLAEQQRAKSCPFCGATLHASNYPRKPRGGPDTLPDNLLIRHSLCCSAEACRRRVLPASCRFWDRRVYWGVVVLVAVVLHQGRTEGYSAARIMRLLGVSRHTLKRWIHYFKKTFPVSDRWKRIRGWIGIELPSDSIPSAPVLLLIERLGSTEGLIRSLQLFSGGADVF
jgi:hypothetical protein